MSVRRQLLRYKTVTPYTTRLTRHVMSAALDNIFRYLMGGLDYEIDFNELADFKKKFLFEGSKTSIYDVFVTININHRQNFPYLYDL